jgi:phenylalanyl-tRNA synthetase beta subunit
MFKVSTNISGLKDLQKHIQNIEKILSLTNDSKYKKFFQDKIMQTLNEVMSERLAGTTNSEYIEEYKGNQIPVGKKSITLRVKIGNDETTMTTEEINNKIESILKTLNKNCGAILREE